MASKVTAAGEVFDRQVDNLRKYAENDSKAGVRDGVWPEWFAPYKTSWDGNPFDIEGLAEEFSRQQHAQEFNSALTGSNSGTLGDLAVSTIQGDFLAQMERAYRSRLRSSVRNKIHAAGRRLVQGSENGVVALGIKNYIDLLIKAGSGG